MMDIVVTRLLKHLQRSGFVIVKRAAGTETDDADRPVSLPGPSRALSGSRVNGTYPMTCVARLPGTSLI
jgi:hypothetical protein